MQLAHFTERRANTLLQRGIVARDAGDYLSALHQFRAAAFVQRTAEALTQWGAMEHFLGDTDAAIELCCEAIAIDPDAGGPCNDIGTYMTVKERYDEAIAWFERAIAAKECELRQNPHINLARVLLLRKEPTQALRHLEAALRYDPGNPEVIDLVRSIRSSLA